MARLSEPLGSGRNVFAFLDMLAWSEGTITSPAAVVDGYDVVSERIEMAILECRNIWGSLPGAEYGQREHCLEELRKWYRVAGGVMS